MKKFTVLTLSVILTITFVSLTTFSFAQGNNWQQSLENAQTNDALQVAIQQSLASGASISAITDKATDLGNELPDVLKGLLAANATPATILPELIASGYNPYQVIKSLIEAGANQTSVIEAASVKELNILNALIAKAVTDAGGDPQDTGLGFHPVLADGPGPKIVGFPGGYGGGALVSNTIP